MEIPESVVEALLDHWPVAHLATLGGEGRPHQVPIVFARARGRIWSPIDAKPKRRGELARVANIRRRPQVSLLLDHYDADWTRLWWIRIDGEAEVREPSAPEPDAEAAAAIAALRAKYPQYERTPLFRAGAVLIGIRESAVRSWCPGPDPPQIGSFPGPG